MSFKDLDDQLKQLAILAQRHPPLSMERRRALKKLVDAILQSGKFYYRYKNSFYEEVYKDGLQNLFLYICQEIEKYDPERGSFMAWVNMLLHKRFLKEAFSEAEEYQAKKISIASNWDRLLNNLALPEEMPSPSERLREYLELDPNDVFKKEYIKNYEEANFRDLMLWRLSGESWKSISIKLGIKVPTLSSFYRRCFSKFSLHLEEYLRR